MVFTRSQKRSFDHTEIVESIQKRQKDDAEGTDDTQSAQSTDAEDTEGVDDTDDTQSAQSTDAEDTEGVEDTDTGSEEALLKQIIKNSINTVLLQKPQNQKPQNQKPHSYVDNNDALAEEKESNEYSKFKKHVESIYAGKFFERVATENKSKTIKEKFSVEDVREINLKLESLKKEYRDNAPSIIDILNMDIDDKQKQKLLEKVYQLVNSDILSTEYNTNMKFLLSTLNNSTPKEIQELEKRVLQESNGTKYSDDYKLRVLSSTMSFENKVLAYKKVETMESYENSDSSEYAKYKNWLDILLSVPFGNYIDIPEDVSPKYIETVRDTLDKNLSFLEKPKDQIINIFAQMMKNPSVKINALGLCGTKGCGKTSLVQSIAESLGRPYRTINVGGESDASMLTGHNFTYIGSGPGRLIDILRETKCMNPVILIDELDKISETNHGKEIIGTLIHLTDSTTNEKYNYDKYFSGVEFDLSKVLFVFTYNDKSKVDKILADRIFTIHIDNYTHNEKYDILKKHIIPNVLSSYKYASQDVLFSDNAIRHIVGLSKRDEGMRDIKRKVEIIVSRINTMLITKGLENIIRLKYKCLAKDYQSLPLEIPREHIDTLLDESFMNGTDDDSPPPHMYV